MTLLLMQIHSIFLIRVQEAILILYSQHKIKHYFFLRNLFKWTFNYQAKEFTDLEKDQENSI